MFGCLFLNEGMKMKLKRDIWFKHFKAREWE